jgi:hypothetical protein
MVEDKEYPKFIIHENHSSMKLLLLRSLVAHTIVESE